MSDLMPTRMHCLLKDHKDPVTGRPVVSSRDAASTMLSKIMVYILQPLTKHIPTHISSIYDFKEFVTNLARLY